MSTSLSYFKAVTFCLLHFELKILFHFPLKSCYILRQKLLHFGLMLHFASKVVTFRVNVTFCVNCYILRRNRMKIIAVGDEALKQLGTQRYEKRRACRDSKPCVCDTDAVCSNQRSYQTSWEQATHKIFGKDELDEVMNIWNSYIGTTEWGNKCKEDCCS